MKKYKNIFKAIEANNIEAVKTFLPLCVDESTDEGETPLHLACNLGHTEIARLLLDNGADIEARNINGETPLHRACLYNHTETVKLLLDRGADIEAIDYEDRTPLHYVCYYYHNNTETVSLLLDSNADIEVKDEYGITPLHLTCHNNNHNKSELLVRRGADPTVVDNEGYTPLDRDDDFVKDESGNKVPHRDILIQLRAEYLNKNTIKESERTAALSSGWEMEM